MCINLNKRQVSSSKEGPDSDFQKHIEDVRCHSFIPIIRLLSANTSQAEILITTPFHPGYLTRDLISKVRVTPLPANSNVTYPSVGEEPQALRHRRRRFRPYRPGRGRRAEHPSPRSLRLQRHLGRGARCHEHPRTRAQFCSSPRGACFCLGHLEKALTS